MAIHRTLRRLLLGTPPAAPSAPSVSSASEPVAAGASEAIEARHELVLYGRSSCGYCRRVNRAIERLLIDHILEHRDMGMGSRWAAELRERTGRGQVPCLFIDGEALFESADIISWLETEYGGGVG